MYILCASAHLAGVCSIFADIFDDLYLSVISPSLLRSQRELKVSGFRMLTAGRAPLKCLVHACANREASAALALLSGLVLKLQRVCSGTTDIEGKRHRRNSLQAPII